MTDVIVSDRFACRRWPTATWVASNEVLYKGEIGFESDLKKRAKRGDGVTGWNGLQFMTHGEIDAVALDAINAGETLVWDPVSGLWKPGPVGLADAASDGVLYGRKNGAWSPVVAGGSSFDPALQIDRYEDWFNGRTTSTNATTNFVTDNALPVVYLGGSGGSATVNVDASGSYLSLATVNTGGAARPVLGGGAKIKLGGGEIRLTASVKLQTLSTPTDRIQLAVGLRDAITVTTKYLEAVYQDNINSGNWRLRSLDAASTDVDTATVGPVAGVFTTVDLIINAAGTSVELLIDGVSQAVLTTNIPTSALAFFVNFGKLAGSASRACDLRYMRFRQSFTTPR